MLHVGQKLTGWHKYHGWLKTQKFVKRSFEFPQWRGSVVQCSGSLAALPTNSAAAT